MYYNRITYKTSVEKSFSDKGMYCFIWILLTIDEHKMLKILAIIIAMTMKRTFKWLLFCLHPLDDWLKNIILVVVNLYNKNHKWKERNTYFDYEKVLCDSLLIPDFNNALIIISKTNKHVWVNKATGLGVIKWFLGIIVMQGNIVTIKKDTTTKI